MLIIKSDKLIKTLKTNKKLLIIIALLIIVALLAFGTTRIIRYNIERNEAEELPEISYVTTKINKNGLSDATVTFANENGIDRITDFTGNTIYAHGKMKIAIDYQLRDRQDYQFTVRYRNGIQKDLTMHYEIPRRQGDYLLENDIYVNAPDLIGYDSKYTRYMYLDENEKLVPGNWINKDKPQNWYDYKDRKWANIFVECEGVESYYVWIPRYCYKVDTINSVSGNERVDIKFINVYDEYIDGQTGDTIEWAELEAQGYQIPEAFIWGNVIIPGYWACKYQLSELSSYKVNFSTFATTSMSIQDVTTNVTQNIAKYEYFVNGEKVYEGTTPDSYTKKNIEKQEYFVNVTIKDSEGQMIGSMTKECEVVSINQPDLTGFDQKTTFYVYWDENGNEHSEIPIIQDPPQNWYDYTEKRWANIVTRNNETETYFVWIPRYKYKLNSTTQRVDIRFVEGTNTETSEGYQIPEAFTWGEGSNKVELTGYWVNKYQISETTSSPILAADIAIGTNSAKVSNIKGTAVTNNADNIKFEYYIDGTKVHEGTDPNENYLYQNLSERATYGFTIIARNNTTDQFLGAVTKKLTTIIINKPDLAGFNKDVTYYVTGFDDEGKAIVGDKIENDGSNSPQNWYDYINRKWANIVVTDGTVENGTITGATYTNYFVWIPRYQYMLDTVNQRVDVKFIEGTDRTTLGGYQIPEAFTWGEGDNTKELTGYWVSKYQLSN